MITSKIARAVARGLVNLKPKPGGVIVVPPTPSWDGTPQNNRAVVLGDSFIANGSSPTSGFENYGEMPTAIRLSGQRLVLRLEDNFGFGGDSSEMAEVRVDTALASSPGWMLVNLGTNDATFDFTAQRTIDSLNRIKAKAFAKKTIVIFHVPPPRGNDTFPEKRLSAPRLAIALERRQRMLNELPGVGCFVTDARDALLKPGTENDIIESMSHDGLHPNTSGAYYNGKPIAAVIIQNAPAVQVISTVENVWSLTNPRGSPSSNLLMNGSVAVTGGGATGFQATNYTGANASGTTGVTRAYSRVVKEGKNWDQCVIGGIKPTSAAALDLFRQISLQGPSANEKHYVPGLLYEVVGEFEIDAGMTNILSLQLGFQIASPTYNATLWDGDRYAEGSFMPSEAHVGVFRSPRFIMPDGVTDMRMRCAAYVSTLGAPVGTVRGRGFELRVVEGQ